MATTSLKDVALGIRGIGERTDFAGAAATDLSAEEDRFANILVDEGILQPVDAFEVVEGSAATMNIVVGSGAAKTDYYLVEGDDIGQGNYLVRLESATETFTLGAADPSNARKDEVYIVVQDNAYDASGRALAVLAVRTGDADPSPAAPGPDAGWDSYALLATIDVPAGAADIVACTVTDNRPTSQLTVDADTLDGLHATAFSLGSHNHDADYTDLGHDGSRDGHPVATSSLDGLMDSTDKAKLDGVESGARANQQVTAGNGLTGGGITDTVTLNHEDTSSQGSVVAAQDSVISGVTLDTYGHVTVLGTKPISNLEPEQILIYLGYTESIGHAAVEPIDFDLTEREDWNGHSYPPGSEMDANAAGFYIVEAQCVWASNSTGIRQLHIQRSGSDIALTRMQALSGQTTIQRVTTVTYLNSFETVRIRAYQESGGNLNLSSGRANTFASLTRIGAPL